MRDIQKKGTEKRLWHNKNTAKMYLQNRPAVIGRGWIISYLQWKGDYIDFFFFLSWFSDFKKLSMWPLVNEVKGIIWEKAVLVLYYFFSLLFLSYFGLELYFLCLRSTIDSGRLKGSPWDPGRISKDQTA